MHVRIYRIGLLVGFAGVVFPTLLVAEAMGASAPPFYQNLQENDRGQDVVSLQQYLNTHGFPLSPAGPGSPGSETDLFGPYTKEALVRFQEYNANAILKPIGLTQGTGNFFESTRNFINGLFRAQSEAYSGWIGAYHGAASSSMSSFVRTSSGAAGMSFFVRPHGGGGGGVGGSVATPSSQPSLLTPTIFFPDFTAHYGDADVAISALSDSSGAMMFTSSDTHVATISGNTVTLLSTGSTTITLMQAAGGNYVGSSAMAVLTVAKGTPVITQADISKTSTSSPFTITPSSASIGGYSFVSSDTTVATISGNMVTILTAGDITITVTQAATGLYESANKDSSLTIIAVDMCTTDPCNFPNGTCTRTSAHPLWVSPPLDRFSCSCSDGFSGLLCDEYATNCDGIHGSACENGGTCTADSSGGSCACVEPYSGNICTDIACDEGLTCQNGGTCNGSSCNCIPCYLGTDCSIFDVANCA